VYICYADESGYAGSGSTANQPILAMAGILVNTYNIHRTQDELSELITLVEQTGRRVQELKGQELYRGTGPWRGMKGEDRHGLYEALLQWLAGRPHRVLLSVLDNARAHNLISREYGWVKAPYVAAGLHLALQVQRTNQSQKRNKGKTLLVYDQLGQHEADLSYLIADPPSDTDPYYGYMGGPRLDQIVDSVYFVRSHHASFIQLADVVAFVARRRAELVALVRRARFPHERDRLDCWWKQLSPRLNRRSNALPPGDEGFVGFIKEAWVDAGWWDR
jgi:hypothetical protein